MCHTSLYYVPLNLDKGELSMKHFRVSFLVTFICLGISAWWGYTHGGVSTMLSALGIAVILGVMEVSLSFDNAVVNASVLKNWD